MNDEKKLGGGAEGAMGGGILAGSLCTIVG